MKRNICQKCGGWEYMCDEQGHIGERVTPKKKFGLPFIGDYTDAVEVSEKQRTEYINEVFEFFENNPTERMYYIGTGDTIIFGVNHDDEIIVMDTKVRKEYSISKED